METWTREQWETTLTEETSTAAFYLYTPMCGTCAVASKMMEVITVMRPEIPIGKADLNYVQTIAIDYEIESVPCLLIQKDGVLIHKIYAFQSVPYLLEKID
ncbi:thioredoxin family protein [Sporosarcina sp. JAI121]|uniref:thioredoxin family protein n=1 Tax=Sporosarcina sp. JAI121 TaxID=2723064 RepID=UPI0015C7065A|nr:thioredoxin family protein [Sporosarcina sp. JAI121]NYF26160.1 thioredoxin-like negative regulator of GroEL [Sporosarcina sp. JAI121]